MAYCRAFITILAVLAVLLLVLQTDTLHQFRVTLSAISANTIVLILLLLILGRTAQAFCLHSSLRLWGEQTTFLQCLDLIGVRAFYNLGFLGAGTIAQAYHAQRQYNTPYTTTVITSALQIAIEISALFIVTAFLLFMLSPDAQWVLALLFLVLSMALPVLFQLLVRIKWEVPRWFPDKMRVTAAFHSNVDLLGTKHFRLLFIGKLIFVNLRISRIIIIAMAMKDIDSFVPIALATAAGDLSVVVSLTPGGIGVREFVIGLTGSPFGILELVLVAAIIDRGAAVIFNIGHGLISIFMSARTHADKRRD